MLLSDHIQKDVLHIKFQGTYRITNGVAQALKEEVVKHLNQCCKSIFIDLNNIHFIDAKSFGELVSLSNLARSHSVRLSLCNVSDEAYELIDMMQLHDELVVSGHPIELAAISDLN